LGGAILPASTEDIGQLSRRLRRKSESSHSAGSWNWSEQTTQSAPPFGDDDDRVFEYSTFKSLAFNNALMSARASCVATSLFFNVDIYSRRAAEKSHDGTESSCISQNIASKGAYDSDIAVLRQANNGGCILRHMVKFFVVELKTVSGYQRCLREMPDTTDLVLMQYKTHCSPPVVLSNLVWIHRVMYLDVDKETWSYSIKVQRCESFAAAISLCK
jgi:hypothetical protein